MKLEISKKSEINLETQFLYRNRKWVISVDIYATLHIYNNRYILLDEKSIEYRDKRIERICNKIGVLTREEIASWLHDDYSDTSGKYCSWGK